MGYELDFGVAYNKPNGNVVKVTCNSFRNKTYVHIREYIYDGDEEKWIPTSKGIAMPAEEVDTVIWLLWSVSMELGKPYDRPLQLEFDFKETE